MSALPDPAELAPSRDPAAYGRARILSPTFWAMMSLCVLCVLAGVAIVSYAPKFWPVRVSPSPAPATAASPGPGRGRSAAGDRRGPRAAAARTAVGR